MCLFETGSPSPEWSQVCCVVKDDLEVLAHLTPPPSAGTAVSVPTARLPSIFKFLTASPSSALEHFSTSSYLFFITENIQLPFSFCLVIIASGSLLPLAFAQPTHNASNAIGEHVQHDLAHIHCVPSPFTGRYTESANNIH